MKTVKEYQKTDFYKPEILCVIQLLPNICYPFHIFQNVLTLFQNIFHNFLERKTVNQYMTISDKVVHRNAVFCSFLLVEWRSIS